MTYPKDKMVEAMIEHAQRSIAKHKANVEVYFPMRLV